jgi:ribulose-5-phosphate 4-epimerase/fuculose-1-phosphate aldolase
MSPEKIDRTKGKLPQKEKGSLNPIPAQSMEEQRRLQLERLAASFRLFSLYGFDEGLAGHITLRDPEFSDHFWVNPLGMNFAHICVSDLLLVKEDGKIIQGDRPINPAAFYIHSSIHKARSDVNSAAHAHSIHGRSFSALGKLLDPITQDAALFFEEQSIYSDYGGVAFDKNEGEEIAKALGDNRTVILQNHGLLTTGSNVDIAAWLFIAMDKCCQSQLIAEAAGKPTIIPDETALRAKTQAGSEMVLWASFQPLYDLIYQISPDFLD